MRKKDFYTSLMYARESRIYGRLAYFVLKMLGVEIPRSVRIGRGCLLVHGGFGVVIHPNTMIGEGVKIYPGVTLGRADIHRPIDESKFKGLIIEDGVILSPGAKILCREGFLVLGRSSVVGANAVLFSSTKPGEIWAGMPAKKISERDL